MQTPNEKNTVSVSNRNLYGFMHMIAFHVFFFFSSFLFLPIIIIFLKTCSHNTYFKKKANFHLQKLSCTYIYALTHIDLINTRKAGEISMMYKYVI